MTLARPVSVTISAAATFIFWAAAGAQRALAQIQAAGAERESYAEWKARIDASNAHSFYLFERDTILYVLLPIGVLFLLSNFDAVVRCFDKIVRWYYFTFYPHPAEPVIRTALSSGSVLDGKALAAVLGERPSGSPAFRAVRVAQAESLIKEMQAMTRRQMDELKARAKEQYEKSAVQQMQAALGEAAVALEKAKIFLRASKRM